MDWMEAMQADAANLAEGKPTGAPRPRPKVCRDCGSGHKVRLTTYQEGYSPDGLMLCRRCFNEREEEDWFGGR